MYGWGSYWALYRMAVEACWSVLFFFPWFWGAGIPGFTLSCRVQDVGLPGSGPSKECWEWLVSASGFLFPEVGRKGMRDSGSTSARRFSHLGVSKNQGPLTKRTPNLQKLKFSLRESASQIHMYIYIYIYLSLSIYTLLYCTVLYCTILYSTLLYSTLLYYTIPYQTRLD